MALVSVSFGLFVIANTVITFLKYDVFTQTKRIVASSLLMPSVTFCFQETETKDLNSFFDTAEFIASNGSKTNLTGEQYFDGYFGDCFKFNHFTNKSDNKLFSFNSLDDYINFNIYLNPKINFYRLRVFLSDNYNNILDWSQYVTTSFNVKGSYIISIDKEVELKLEKPYNPCKNVNDFTYRKANCMVKCKSNHFLRKYNCSVRNYYSIPGLSFCSEYGVSNFTEFDSECKEQCPQECTTNKFSLFLNNLNIGSNFSEFELKFKFYYLDLSYTEISQTPKISGYSLLNEIGGALGLFVGITFLSLFELFEFLFEIFLVFCV